MFHIYRLALWGKFSAIDILNYFPYFSQKIGIDSNGDNFHEMSNPVFLESKKIIICYATGDQDAPRVPSNLIKVQVGQCLF